MKKTAVRLCARHKLVIWQADVAWIISRQDGAVPPTAYCPTGLDIVSNLRAVDENSRVPTTAMIGIQCLGCGVM